MAETIGTAYVQIEPSFNGVVHEIDKQFGGAGESSSKSFGKGFASVVGTVGKVAASAAAAGTAAVARITKQAVSAYADFEQLEGGAKLLFGSAFTTVLDNASTAFSRVQMSANDYLSQANGYATGLKEALGGDEQAAANLADRIMVAQADIVAATGESQEAIQNAFNGIMKNNFMMLDNLKLGIKPTKEGMQEVIDKMNEWNASQGHATKYQMDNLADMESAIVDYVTYVGMAGYAHDEASTTIQGSLASMKAAWENTLSAIGQGNMDILSDNIEALVGTVGDFAGNIMPVVERALTGIVQLISQLAPKIADALPDMISSLLPQLLTAGVDIVQSLAEGIINALPTLMPAVVEAVTTLCEMIIDLAPQLIQVGADLLVELIQGFADAIPTLMPKIVDVVLEIVQTLIDNIPLLVEAANSLVQGLAEGIIAAIPVLIEALPQLISSLVDAIVTSLPILIQGTIQLVTGIVNALPDIIVALVEAIPQIVESVVQGLIQCLPQLIVGIVQLVLAIVDALPEICAALKDAMPQIIAGIVDAIIECAPMFFEAGNQLFMGIVEAWTGSIAPQLLSSAGDTMSNLISTITTYLSQLPERMAYYAGYAVGQFIVFMQNLPSKLASMWSELLANVKSFGTSFIQNAPRIAKEFATQLINGLNELPGQMISIGKNIVDGLLNGIKGAWDGLTSTVREMASSFVQGVKDSMKIGSPSKVMADEVGRWIPAGIAEGIKDNVGVLNGAINGMSRDMLQASVTGSMETINSHNYALLSPSGDEGRPIVFNNNITVNGAQDPEAWTQTFIRTLKREARMA